MFLEVEHPIWSILEKVLRKAILRVLVPRVVFVPDVILLQVEQVFSYADRGNYSERKRKHLNTVREITWI